MGAKAILKAGIVFDAKDIDTSQIKNAIVQSIAQAKISAARGAGVPGAAGAARAAAPGPADIVAKTKQSIAALQAYHTGVSRADQSTFNYLKLLRQGATSAEEFGAKIGQITTRFSAYLVSLRALFAIQQAFNESLRFIFEFDDALQDLQKVLRGLPDDLERAAKGIFKVSQETGNSALQVAESFNVFIRTGIGVEEALERTKSALIAVNISELNVTDATKLIISTMRIFREELSNDIEALDILSVTADNAATSAGEIGRAILRAGAAAQAVGLSFKELNALVAATEEATKLGGGVIGSAFKTIFARVAGSADQLRIHANALGANIEVGDSVFQIFGKLNVIWDSLNKTQRQQIAQIVAGKRRFTEFNATVLSFGRAQELLEKQSNAAGTAFAKNEIELQKLSTRAQLAVNAFAEFISELTSLGRGAEGVGSIRDSLSSMLDILTSVGTGLTEIVRITKDLSTTFFSVTSALKIGVKAGILLVGVPIIKKIIAGFAQFTGLVKNTNTVLLKLANTQSIIPSYINNANIAQNKLLATTERQVISYREMDAILGRITAKSRATRGITIAGNIERARSFRDLIPSAGRAKELARTIGAAGLLVAVQSVTDSLRNLSEEVKSTGIEGAKLKGALADAGVVAGEFGTFVGITAGTIRGLEAAAIAASLSFVRFALEEEKGAKELLAAEEKAAGGIITLAKALREGSDVTAQAIKEFAEESGTAQKGIINESALLARELRILSTSTAEFKANLSELAQTTARIVNEVAGIDLVTDIRGALETVAAEFRARELELKVEAETGGLKQLSGINKEIAEAQANLERFIGPVHTISQLFGGIQVAQQAINDLSSDTTQKAFDIVQRYGLMSQKLRDIIKQEEKITDEITPQLNAIRSEISARESAIKRLEKEKKEADEILALRQKTKQSAELIETQQKKVSEIEKTIKEFNEAITKEKEIQEKLESSLVELGAKKEEIAKKDLDNITKLATGLQKIINQTKLLASESLTQTAQTNAQIEIIKERGAIEKQILQKSITARTLAEKETVEQLQLSKQLAFDVLQVQKERAKVLENIQKRINEAAAAGDIKTAQLLKEAGDRFREQAAKEIQALNIKAGIEFELKLQERAREQLEKQEQALLNFRINAINQAISKEEEASRRRIQLIEQLSETSLGREFLQEEFKPSQFMEREFGLVGSIIINELESSTETAIGFMVQRIEELKQSGADAFEVLSATQEVRAQIEQKIDDLTWRKREILLDRVKNASDNVANAEKRLVDERNKIPALNAKVIESQRELASANASVDEATKNLQIAMKAASDATVDLRFNTLKAVHDIRVFAGSVEGVEALSSLRSIFSQIERETRVSGEKLLQIRAQLAQEELNILKQQFNTFKGLGIEAATATDEQFAKIQESLATASAITRGVSPGEFTAEQLAAALQRKDLFAGLERTIAEFGLKKLGIDPSVLKSTEEQMVELAKITAQTGQEQVNSANAQVLAAQQALHIAEDQRATAREGLKFSQEQLAAQVNMAGAMASQLQASVLGFHNLADNTSKQLAILNEQRAATDKIGNLLGTIDNTINNATKEIISAMSASISKLSSVPGTGPGGGGIPSVAHGSLTTTEIGRLLGAARREKQLMPPGSRLMLANTSETVFTRKQSRDLGLKPIPKLFAANGNAVIERSTSALTNAVNTLNNRLNDPNFINQNINVQVDTERNVNVRGLDSIDSAMRKAFETRSKGFVSKEEQKAIQDVVVNVVERLGELGIVNSRGV